ncbi:Tfx family DNA-binding protein [Halalkalicoccus jeotgali]|uniref:Transcriptional regulator n=1 Tax=Halalkalicoccus jeotgali (strain DSM 18796 / CECT 7217 / JCM 14584 / KCTC 4019 / B3) TaxID=795797 RepID=D8JBA3_HALJB|nr:Tfx family DNA-binding protein [Halalkalicoccus jeotgali]ADJ16556.1 putative transcriptional regulator [Halalkalicoccus jeotgali B3]ELY41348.1 transcriptional regulator [Halalkalicoccus jeotgali B3]
MDPRTTNLTDRQLEVLEHRERGHTQQEIATELGTTDSNVSAVERAAEANIEKARRTLELVRTLRAPAQFSASAGTCFDDLVDRIYTRGDEAGIKIAYCRPELYAHLYGLLEAYTDSNRLDASVTIGLTEDGDVKVFTEDIEDPS